MFLREGDQDLFRTYFIDARGDEAMGSSDLNPTSTVARPPGGRRNSPEGYPQTPTGPRPSTIREAAPSRSRMRLALSVPEAQAISVEHESKTSESSQS